MGYYYVIKYRERVPSTEGAAGRIIMPAGVQSIAIERRHIRLRADGEQGDMLEALADEADYEAPPEEAMLLDPQLYLAGLSCHTCSHACANLVGYPWFHRVLPDPYDSGKITQNNYRKQVKSKIQDLWKGVPENDDDITAAVDAAVDMQVNVGCDEIILPSPLTIDPGSAYMTEINWLDRGLKAARKRAPEMRAYATVALSDICTFSAEPNSNRLLETILDHVTAREPGGVYILIEQRVNQGYYISSSHTLRTLLRLVAEFKEAGIPKVVVSWVGLAGFAALAVGADGWGSGWYRSERRLKLDDFKDDSGGPAAAAIYSHRLCGDIHPGDLERLRDAEMLDLITDETPAAEPLFRALRAGKKVRDVALWTNDAARAHFNTVLIRETRKLQSLAPSKRAGHVTDWLKGAGELATEVAKLGSLHDRTTVTHQATWSAAFKTHTTPANDDTSRTHSGD